MPASIATLAPPAATDQVPDAEITTAIELLYLTKKGVSSHLLDVATHDGIVELTGFVDNLLARQRAEEIALAVRGVRGVVNELAVLTADVPDQQLKRDVEHALATDSATADYNVRVVVADGVVNLAGAVQSWPEKELVLRVLRGVRGVRKILADHLGIRGGTLLNSDEEITAQIRELLDWDIRVNSALVQVRTTDRAVHLAGTVGTAAEKARIVATAYEAGAARADARDLFVAPWALPRELRRDKFGPRSDEAVAQAVRDTFLLDPRVFSYEPRVQVHHGVVTLAGTVSNLRAKQAAELDARDVVGVWDVHNLLKVRPPHLLPDDTLRQALTDALARDPYVGHFPLQVSAHNGRAHLHGPVNNHFEQERAGEVAAGVTGVVAVDNRVHVPNCPAPTDLDALEPSAGPLRPAISPNPDLALAARIRGRYCWSASLHDQEVAVEVENGRATLSGTVDTWLDRRQAALEAFEVGARDVNNHLRVLAAEGH